MHVMPGDAPEHGRREPVCMFARCVPRAGTRRLMAAQENNEMSGSRGEANFVWKCKNCKVCSPPCYATPALCFPMLMTSCPLLQRESSASIKAAATPYEQSEPPKSKRIIEFDCRGLEFIGFDPKVSSLSIINIVYQSDK